MKRKFFLAAIAGSLLMSSCSKDNNIVTEPPGGSTETKTPVGLPIGTAITKTIGTTGGEISSNDGRIKVIIPAGALDAPKEFNIQAISNELPEGIGQAYRLGPHGSQFSKPVTVLFNYMPADTMDTRAEFLDIAYQDEQGTWQMMTNTVLNKTQHSIAVATSHFSDWGYFKSIKLTPSAATVEQGSFHELKLTTNFPKVDPDDQPPGSYTIPVLKKTRKLRPDEVKGWSYAGEGTLEGDGPSAFYTAPDHEPGVNPEAITAHIKMHRKGQFMLVSNIVVLGATNVKYLHVDEDFLRLDNAGKCRLYMYGSFGNDPGAGKRSVKINGVLVEVDLWSPTILRCKIDEDISGPVEIIANGKIVARTVLRKFTGKFLYERFHGGLLNSGSSNALKEMGEFKLVYRGFGAPCPDDIDPVFQFLGGALAAGTEVKYTLKGSATVTTPVVNGCVQTTSVTLPTSTGWYFLEPESQVGFTGFKAEAKDEVGGIEIKIWYMLSDIVTGVRVQRSNSCGASSQDPPRPLGVALEGFMYEPIKLEFWGTDELKLRGTSQLKTGRMASGILIEAWDNTVMPSHYESDGLMRATFSDVP